MTTRFHDLTEGPNGTRRSKRYGFVTEAQWAEVEEMERRSEQHKEEMANARQEWDQLCREFDMVMRKAERQERNQ